ncbi:hypothetical protein BpHYR1_015314 [Brachionus plicatilis]|uniref:PARP catalytic domain-containing protein n=1 Tax=Brachionus plicatilis TaxID=10195 RepID=A0A3M7QDL6_BRAPC|nr:hypothetical protein BpHYR1_015314 [Brachionus plicatilis]
MLLEGQDIIYLFMPQFLRFMRMSEFGSMGCLASENCSSLDLEHIVLCHNELNIPNQNCRCCYDCTCRDEYLVGFHQTKYHPALSISLSPMRLTQDKDSWFGPGIYFARRFSDTKRKVGKNGGLGSLIVALVDMKRRKDVYRDADNTRDDLSNFDSIYVHRGFYKKPYLKPRTDKLYSLSDDEFLIFNENQIVQFIMMTIKKNKQKHLKNIYQNDSMKQLFYEKKINELTVYTSFND